MMKFTAILSFIATAAAQAEPFETAPFCGDVWDPTSPPAVADATVLGTVAYLDSIGYFGQGTAGVLQGTVPFDVYLQVAMASVFGALDAATQTAAQQQCLGTFELSLGRTNALTPVIDSDMTAAVNASLHWEGDLMAYVANSMVFFETRLCPCYNMIPRAIMENLNCRPTPLGSETLSNSFLICNAVDMDAIYSDPQYAFNGGNGLAMQMPQNRNAANIANWQGGVLSTAHLFRSCCPIRDAAYSAAIDMFGLGSGSSVVSVPYDGSWLDTVAGTFVTMPATTTTTGASTTGSGNFPQGRYTGEGGRKGMGMGGKGMSEGGKGMSEGGKGMGMGGKGMSEGGKGMGMGGKGMGEGGSGKGMSEGGRKGHGAQMTASFASKVNSPQGVGAMVGVIALVAGTAFISVRRARNRAGDVESQSDETTALVDGTSSPTII